MKHLTVQALQKKFKSIAEITARSRPEGLFNQSRTTLQSQPTNQSQQPVKPKQPTTRTKPVPVATAQTSNVLSKNDIIKSVIKIKPYLQEYDNQPQNRYEDFEAEEEDLLSEMLIRQNNRLCEKLNRQEAPVQMKVSEKKKPGCVFEISFYEEQVRVLKAGEVDAINTKMMNNAYAVVTEILQIYLALADVEPVSLVEMKNIEFVKYQSDLEFDYMRIKRMNSITNKKTWVNIGFISKKQFHLFDRMLFLAKQISRTSPGRLFDNKLLYEILENY